MMNMLFGRTKKCHVVGGFIAGAVIGMTVAGTALMCKDKNLCKQLKKDAVNVGNMLRQGINQIF